MRIRKNAKLLSSLLFTPQEPPPTHMCQLNQSPWDVIPFSSLPPYQQLDGEDFTFAGNGNWADPTAASDSVAAMMVDNIPKQENGGFSFSSNNDDNDNDNKGSDVSYGAKVIRNLAVKGGGCRKSNGKGWHCTRGAREGHYFCDHHLKSHQSQNANNYSSASAAKKGGTPGEVSGQPPCRPGRGRPPKKAHPKPQPLSSKSNSNQFYYYSGFGPLWGKRRNERVAEGCDELLPAEAMEETSTTTSLSSLQIDGDEMEDEDELSEDSSGSGCGGRKRTRKPVKARSLKSLM